MRETAFTTVDRILSKLSRDIRNTDLNESDVIEWIGEALEFLKVESIQKQHVIFLEVQNYTAIIPKGFQMVLQIVRNNDFVKEVHCKPIKVIQSITENNEDIDDEDIIVINEKGFVIEEDGIVDYRVGFDLKLNYNQWINNSYYKRQFTPVRLSNNTLFNSIVAKEKISTCNNCKDEYTIVGTIEKCLRFNFEEGQIAMAYLKNAIDCETGYPLVPDNISYITAITYYVQWKIAQYNEWNGREGFARLAQDKERLWLKYCKQATNYAKMPKSIDDYQDLLEASHYTIPDHNKYYGYFGNLGKTNQLNYQNDGK